VHTPPTESRGILDDGEPEARNSAHPGGKDLGRLADSDIAGSQHNAAGGDRLEIASTFFTPVRAWEQYESWYPRFFSKPEGGDWSRICRGKSHHSIFNVKRVKYFLFYFPLL